VGSPRLDVVFCFWQCDKKNHGWREGLPLTVSAKFRSRGPGLHPPVKSVSNEKRILFSAAGREPHSEHWPVINAKPVEIVHAHRTLSFRRRGEVP